MDIPNSRRTGRKSHCTGHTMRRWYPRGQYYETYRGQFSIHKGLRIYETHSPEEIAAVSEVFKECFDDGGLEADIRMNNATRRYQDSVLYSQNKRKRWLLAQRLKDNIADTSCHDNLDFKVILEERELSLCFKRRNYLIWPDCIRVYESKSDQPEKLPNQKYSYAIDLRTKSEPTPRLKDLVEEDPPQPEPNMMEIYYEMCYARPEENTPWRKMLKPPHVIGTKASSKVKHQKNKCYSYWHGLSDSYDWARDVRDRWNEDEAIMVEVETEMMDDTYPDFTENILPVTLPSIGDVIIFLLENSDNNSKRKKRSKKAGQKSSCEDIVYPNQASSNPVKVHGKGATIYEEPQETSDDHLDNETSENEPTLNDEQVYQYTEQDIRFTRGFKFSTPTTLPSHLKDSFGSAYIECMSHPHRFAVDVAHQFTACEGHIYVLFEMMDNYANGNSVSYKWHDTEDVWQTLDVNEYTSARVSLIISPQVYALNEGDFSGEMHAGSGEVHTVADVVRWMADMVNDRMGITNKSNTCKKKPSRYVLSIDTVTKASDWQLLVDTPHGAYQDIQQKSKTADPCDFVADFIVEFSPFCGICYESLLPSVGGVDATAINACGHRFCDECWTKHFRSRVQQGDFNITCPGYECKSAIDIVTKMALMTTSDFFHHLDHQRDATLNRKAEWQWCPNPKCGRMACVVSGIGSVAVKCVCGWLWCSQCMQEAHWPATCKQAARYRDLTNGMALSKDKMLRIISVEVKRCPTCNYPMEKNGGCPNMICRMCDTSFCWKCLGLWSTHIWNVCPRAASKMDLELEAKVLTVKHWKADLDQLDEWLKYEMMGGKVVKVKCLLCAKYELKLKWHRNFNSAFIAGITETKIKKDNVNKHAKADMHVTAVNLDKKSVPIVELIDIAYLLAKKEKPFKMFPDIAEIEKRHGVELGNTYLNDKYATEFTDCIAQTVYLENKRTGLIMNHAMHHRQRRTKSAIEKCRTDAYMLSAREFLKESTSSNFNTPTSLFQGEWAEHLPFTWTSSATSFASLAEKVSQGQECAKFCVEAHFVLEFLAIYMGEKKTWTKHRRLFSSLTDRLEFITQRLDVMLQARLHLSRAKLLTKFGKNCLKQLALQIKKTQNVEEAE